MTTEILDARGVPIAPGDTALYGFGVGRSVAMAEGVVLGEQADTYPHDPSQVSLTPSGRVRLRVIRRSYADGEKPVVDVAPDRLVVLKHGRHCFTDEPRHPYLPPSPLPTQDEVARAKIEEYVRHNTEGLRATELPNWWNADRDGDLAAYHRFCASSLAENRRKLRALDV